MEANTQFRNVFNIEVCNELSERIHAVYPDFDRKKFLKIIALNFETLTFSERNLRICDALKETLPEKFEQAVEVLLNSQTGELEVEELEGFRGFIVMPQATYISSYGMENVDLSLMALEEMTKRFTSEFAIRYFIRSYPEKTFKQIKKWAVAENCHVRRLASEGTRPRLPWGMRLTEFIDNPEPVLKILDIMKFSPERLVQRSIANNLNDIAKDNPGHVTEILKRWQREGVSNWLITHSLRTLFKQGNPEALELCGYNPEAEVSILDFSLTTPQVEFGTHVEFSIELVCKNSEKLMIDYVIHHMKANGSLSPKVFKLAKKSVSGHLKLSKKHSMRSLTTRKYYPGRHMLQIQVNGRILAEQEFTLKM